VFVHCVGGVSDDEAEAVPLYLSKFTKHQPSFIKIIRPIIDLIKGNKLSSKTSMLNY
jgi:hypothetical protein